jgi:RimJ/RimL family protein N-acetyltransferase
MIKYDDEEAAHYVAAKTGVVPDMRRHNYFGVYKKDQLVGGVLFTDWNGHSCAIHMAGEEGWANRDVIWSTFYWPFEVLSAKVIFAYVAETNERALKINRRLGFKDAGRIDDVFADGALIVLRMYKHECKYLDIPFRRGQDYGQQGTSGA